MIFLALALPNPILKAAPTAFSTSSLDTPSTVDSANILASGVPSSAYCCPYLVKTYLLIFLESRVI